MSTKKCLVKLEKIGIWSSGLVLKWCWYGPFFIHHSYFKSLASIGICVIPLSFNPEWPADLCSVDTSVPNSPWFWMDAMDIWWMLLDILVKEWNHVLSQFVTVIITIFRPAQYRAYVFFSVFLVLMPKMHDWNFIWLLIPVTFLTLKKKSLISHPRYFGHHLHFYSEYALTNVIRIS